MQTTTLTGPSPGLAASSAGVTTLFNATRLLVRRGLARTLAGLALALLLVSGAAAAEAKTYPVLDVNSFVQLIQANKGKIIVVNFFASWCPPCREEIPGLLAARKDYSPEKVVFIGISLDRTPEALAAFAEKVGFTYPVYYAAPDLAPALGINALPRNVIHAPDGSLVLNVEGLIRESDLREALDKLM